MVFQIDFVLRYLDTGIGNHSGGIRQKVQDMAQNLYIDTRGCADRPVAFTEAVVDGLAQGGGLYVPERIPSLSLEDILALADLPYAQRAARIYRAFDIDLPDEVVDALMAQAYGKNFDDERICPLTSLDAQTHVLELWHGPTSAFKDMALQCLPRFFSASAQRAARARTSWTTTSSSWSPLRATRARPHWKGSRTPKGCASACCSPTAA